MQKTAGTGRLKVGSDGHFIVRENGEPFFYLADTGWTLFHRLGREEADEYLEVRAKQGFTVIQVMGISEFGGLSVPNPSGHTPFRDNDPTRPIEGYFEHVDCIVRKANALGLFIAYVPTWGDKVSKRWGEGPEIFNEQNARVYGEFLGRRYRDSGVIWVLGGDRSPIGYEPIWRAMALGLKAGDGGAHLATFHGADGDVRGSAPFFHQDDWLDVNMYYSGHAWSAPNYEGIARDYALEPVKPTFDGEPVYENHPYVAAGDGYGYHGREKKLWDGITRGNAHQMRQAAYWAMLAGACGHTYGCHDVWQMYDGKRTAVGSANTHWRQAMQFHGAQQMGLMRRLFESRPWQRLVPDPSLVTDGQGLGSLHVQAARADDRSFALVYVAMAHPVSIDLAALRAERVAAHWFSPRDGAWTAAGEHPATGPAVFEPPAFESRRVPEAVGGVQDWVLVLDDAAKGYPAGG